MEAPIQNFNVPCVVADNFLKIASGEQLKVLLYLLRNGLADADANIISEHTGVPGEQVEAAVAFWKNCNIISGETVSEPRNEPASENMFTPVQLIANASPAPVVNVPVAKRTQLRPNEITEIISTNSGIAELFQSLQAIIPVINPYMQNSLIWIYNYYGFSAEVIYLLVSYCSAVDKLYVQYIEKIAESWSKNGIATAEQANYEVARLMSVQNIIYEIKSMFEMKRNPTTKQQAMIDKWLEFEYDMDVIKYAYEKNIENIEKLSFSYIDKILTSWHLQGLKTLDEVQAFEASEAKKRSSKFKKTNVSSDGFDADKYDIVINSII